MHARKIEQEKSRELPVDSSAVAERNQDLQHPMAAAGPVIQKLLATEFIEDVNDGINSYISSQR